jgi:ABC-type multidrug transport system fused ATPase/permease subunit
MKYAVFTSAHRRLGTFRENILLGVDESEISEEQLHQACRDASIHDFIVSLPEGYNTNLGSKGVSLSGGQKQRVGIARALIRNPSILLLDEATSSLDSESEKIVQAAFERAGKGRTMIVVAHRLATVQNADNIFVLGEGKLLEQGNHAELLKKKGVYWNMVSDAWMFCQCVILTYTSNHSARAKLSTDRARSILQGIHNCIFWSCNFLLSTVHFGTPWRFM